MRALLRAPPAAKVGMAVVLFYAAMAVLGPFLAPYGEAEAVGDVWEPFSAAFPLGTDSLGRDILTRMLWGATNTIGVALAATALSFAIGMTLGYIAAVVGGGVDLAISRSVDVLMAIPTLIFALVVLSEEMSLLQVLGGIVIAGGILLARQARPPAPSPD